MPVTFAHPSILLPLLRSPLPFAALAAGSMVPDLPLFAPWVPFSYEQTHTPVGVVTIDLCTGLLGWVAWWFVRAPLADAVPDPVRTRLHGFARSRPPRLLLGPLAVVLGAASHVLWDEFTHPGRWGAAHIRWLAADHAGMAGVTWAQYVSGVGGLLVLAVVAAIMVMRTRPRATRPRVVPGAGLWILGLPVLAAVGAVVSVVGRGLSLHDLAYAAVTRGAAGAVLALLTTALTWHILARQRDDRTPDARVRA